VRSIRVLQKIIGDPYYEPVHDYRQLSSQGGGHLKKG